MLYTCCNTPRNTWQGCCGFTNVTNTNGGCYGTNVTNTNVGCYGTNVTNTNVGCANTSNTTFTNGVYGVFIPLPRPYCVRRTTPTPCGTNNGWTNGCCGCRRNLCTTNSTPVVIDGEAYYARQYGLNTGCGCGCGGYGNTVFNNLSTND